MAKKKAKLGSVEQKRVMSARDEELQKMLADRRDALQTEINTQRREFREQETNFADSLDAASDAVAGNNDSALSRQKNETLAKIIDALSRLDAGEYGNCTDCGGEIAEKRLMAVPFAVRCRECEEKLETAKPWERQSTHR